MGVHADRYAQAMARAQQQRTLLGEFSAGLDFELDDFQITACRALERDRSVLVAAPTGAGKTIVGEFAVFCALKAGKRAFYTTPIKALSNQKFAELSQVYGHDKVGLLTGDNAINPGADVVVMTTEVLRNMIYENSQAPADLSHVVMDEVHYLADRARGAVWEEVLIQLPTRVRIAALSATVSNAEEFGDWLAMVRGETDVVVAEHRPVPLYQHVVAGNQVLDLYSVADGDEVRINPELARLAEDARTSARLQEKNRRRQGYRRRSTSQHTPSRMQVVAALHRAELLPAIFFIFSRNGCDAAANLVADSGLALTTSDEADLIIEIAESRCAHMPGADLALLGFDSLLSMWSQGIAAHHAGLLPTFKEVVEDLFQRGLIKVVFATETLALGINMPARSVVLEKLSKWNGETHADITPGEYTQLTGRAGRRGIDVEGHAVVMWHDGFSPTALAGLAATRTYPLRSSFRPSYNMAVNLVARLGVDQAREVLETSLAQFQADRAVVGLTAKLRRQQEGLVGYQEAMTCHLGDFAEYARLRARISDRERELSRKSTQTHQAQIATSIARLRRGDVIVLPTGRRSGPAVVVEVADPLAGIPAVQVINIDRTLKRVTAADFTAPVSVLATMKVSKNFPLRSPHARRELAMELRQRMQGVPINRPRANKKSLAASDAELASLRASLRQHPCHGCSDREAHARWGERYHKLKKETDTLQARVRARTNTIARQFDRVCSILLELGYLAESAAGLQVTASGHLLERMYNENDLIASESIRTGLWQNLTPPELAAVCSALVYSGRTDEPRIFNPPTRQVAQVLREQARLFARLNELEHASHVDLLRGMDVGFAEASYAWVNGSSLPHALGIADMAAGDFVRWCKQLADFLDQVANATRSQASDATTNYRQIASTAAIAADSIRRGVVDYSTAI